MQKIRVLPLILGLMLTAAAHGHGEGHAARHGGRLIEAGDYTLEWVAQENALYLSDHGGKDLATEGASGKIIAVGGGKKSAIDLIPAGGNRLNLREPLPTGADVKAVISITLSNRAPIQARLEETK